MGVKVRFVAGKWCIEVNHDRRRTRKVIGTSKEAAVTVAKQVELQLAMNNLGVFGVGDGKSDEFRAYAQRWLDDGEAGRKATTHRFYRYNINLHLLPVLGDRPIADISRADARAVVNSLRKKNAKVHVVKAAVRVASAILSQAVDDGLRSANPFFRMGKHTRSADELVNDENVRAMTRDQVRHLLDVAAADWPEHYAFYLTALRTGMRLGELLALKWDAIDFDARAIDVRLNYTGGKFTTVKNKMRRQVHMSDQLVDGLKTYRAQLQERAMAMGKPTPDLVFCEWGTDAAPAASWWMRRGAGREGPVGVGGRKAEFGTVLDGDNFRKRVHAKVMAQAKVAGFTIHELRHTFASLMIFAGQPLAYISKQLGHSSIQITVDTYGHLLPSADRSAVNVLDDQPVLSANGVAVK